MSESTLEAQVRQAAELLERLTDDPAVAAEIRDALRLRLTIAAGRFSLPSRKQKKTMRLAVRRRAKQGERTANQAALERTGIRSARRRPVFPSPPPPGTQLEAGPERGERLTEDRYCYVCKATFQTLHHFYDQMCAQCAALNWDKRNQTADLASRVALITGARVKIGYQAALKLLRAGASVVVTTRFPRDAAARYATEEDYAGWADRLRIYGLDLRHTPSVERFCHQLTGDLDRLDFILNNACQTVRRPSGFYRHLLEAEAAPAQLPPTVASTAGALTVDSGVIDSALLSQVPLVAEDRVFTDALFPSGQLDADLQQVDLRDKNSWRLRLHEVGSVELFEVTLVNAIAPFIINARLKPLMLQSPQRDKHIVNVSAMEGQFYRYFKTDKHPHTNMAKAALNMLTRTSAADYVKDGVHMNSVDTGWVTDEDPAHVAERKAADGFTCPLDIVDGAARIVDPIFTSINDGEHVWGQFLKDYRPVCW